MDIGPTRRGRTPEMVRLSPIGAGISRPVTRPDAEGSAGERLACGLRPQECQFLRGRACCRLDDGGEEEECYDYHASHENQSISDSHGIMIRQLISYAFLWPAS